MNKPRLLKIHSLDSEAIDKIESIIGDTLLANFIQSYPIEDFTLKELDALSEYAKMNDIVVTLRAEHSNFHQGVLVGLTRRDVIDRFIKHI